MTLTPAQARAVAARAERLQILACAGSGKTEVLARRASRLLAEGAEPASIVAFTFTDKAAHELKTRIELRAVAAGNRFARLTPVGHGMFVGTMHAWALAMLRRLGGSHETMDGLTPEQEWALVHRVVGALGVRELWAARHRKIDVPAAIRTFLRSVEVVHDQRIDRDELTRRVPDFTRVLDRYEQLLRDMCVLPFRMMIGDAADELRADGRLAALLQGRVAHVLVDEYQDLNPAQDELVTALGRLGATIAVVADDDQAIYQWRGGDITLFSSFATRHPGVVQAPLEQNHRSRPEIVAFAERLVLELYDRVPKELDPARPPAPGGAIEVLAAEDPVEEAEAIAARIAALLEDGHRPGDIAVLYRSVRSSARPLIEALARRAVPAVVAGRTSLLARPEMALIARIYVRWASKDDDGYWQPTRGETEVVTHDRLLAEIRAVTGADPAEAARRLQRVEALGAAVRGGDVTDGVALFDELIAALGLPGTSGDASARELALGRMSELLTEFDHALRRAIPARFFDEDDGPQPVLGKVSGSFYLLHLRSFLQEFAARAAEERSDDSPQGHDAVQVMTVHQSKGLEFPVVFVPALVLGRFPSGLTGRREEWYVPDELFDRSRYEGRDEDEARLLYVALTRARELLVVSLHRRHRDKDVRPSPFLQPLLGGADGDVHRCGETRVPVTPPKTAAEADPLDLTLDSLVTYGICPHRHWLRYLCGFQPPLAVGLGYGKLLRHAVGELARAAARDGVAPDADDAAAAVARDFYLPFAGPTEMERLRTAAQQRIGRYVRDHGEELTRAIATDVSVELPIGAARLRGRVDLLLRAPNAGADAVELLCFGTAASPSARDLRAGHMRALATAATEMGMRPVRLAIHELGDEHGDRTVVAEDAGAVEQFERQVDEWASRIRAGEHPPTEDPAACRACDFRTFCAYAR